MSTSFDIDEKTLQMCPQFVEFNKQCIIDLSTRYCKHNQHRSHCVIDCANQAIRELCQLLGYESSMRVLPIFEENTVILKSAQTEMNSLIQQTSVVNASRCHSIIKTYQEFLKKANNKQDQNSWKISGKYFFRPYVHSFIQYLRNDIAPIMCNGKNKANIVKLAGLLFAQLLLVKKVKFERAKEKPLIRDRTLVKSAEMRESLYALHSKLNAPRFFAIEKNKINKSKKTIVSQIFHSYLLHFTKHLLSQNTVGNSDVSKLEFPKEWLSDTEMDTSHTNHKKRTKDMSETKKVTKKRKLSYASCPVIITNDLKLKLNENINGNFNNEVFIFGQIQMPPPMNINRVTSETIMNGDMHTNDLGYSFNNVSNL